MEKLKGIQLANGQAAQKLSGAYLADGQGKQYQIELAQGWYSVLWQRQRNEPTGNEPMAASTTGVYIGFGEKLYFYDNQGNLGQTISTEGIINWLSADNQGVYVASSNNQITRYDLQGHKIWSQIGNVNRYFYPATTRTSVYLNFDSELRKYDHVGNLLWKATFPKTVVAIAANERAVYVAYVNENEGEELAAFDPDGNRKWTIHYKKAGDPGGLFNGLAAANDGLIVNDGIHLIRYDSTGKIKWMVTNSSGASPYPTPELTNNGFAMRSVNGLILFYDDNGNFQFSIHNSFFASIATNENVVYILDYINDVNSRNFTNLTKILVN